MRAFNKVKKIPLRSFFFIWGCVGMALLNYTTDGSAKSVWFERESEHFVVIYRESHAYLVPHILRSAEDALMQLMALFDYKPDGKIIINTYDFSDYGVAGASTVPHNFIRLEIEPLELGYENIPYNERIRWLLAHELVHIVVNDLAFDVESFNRRLFSRVLPEKEQPLSAFYSLLTNFGRFTPRWYQEGIAVFMETWLSGGYGRILGSFDEMFFRTMVLEDRPFPTPSALDTKIRHNSFLHDVLFYLYGARFTAYLALTYGTDKLLAWYRAEPGEFYKGFESKFAKVFGRNLDDAWQDFITAERSFQQANISRLKSAPVTPVKRLQNRAMGWVTQPYVDSSATSIFFAHREPHYLTSINALDIRKHSTRYLGSLQNPSVYQIASTAYDYNLQHYFYTTNNNQLYRDLWVLNAKTKQKKMLFKDARVGQLTVSPETHELWAVRHSGGKAALVYSPVPYRLMLPLVEFDFGDILQHLAISSSGRYLAATLHQSNGRQAIIVADVDTLKRGGKFTFEVISDAGSPEFPAWSPDESKLYWNAYTNGVSNIFRYNRESRQVEAMSHTLGGLFRPAYISSDSLFAFEFSSDGFYPVLLANKPVQHVPAISYYGQQIVEKAPEVVKWANSQTASNSNTPEISASEKGFRGISHLRLQSLIPVISGFQSQEVIGLFMHFGDPMYQHDFVFEVGYSPFNENAVQPKTHFRGKYKYKGRYNLGLERNASSFYDLFNERKQGMIGTKITLGHTKYWKFDFPHRVKQTSELAIYTGIQAINDNLVRVSNPDFFVFQWVLNSRNLRRAIGSVDSEQGTDWTITLMNFAVNPNDLKIMGGLHAEWDRFLTWAWPHNVLHVKLAGGYRHTKDRVAIGRFYFGGFGNRNLENQPVKQYRKVFRFPGIPIYSRDAGAFAKIMLEHNLPPLRLGNVKIASHFLQHIDASWFSQGLIIDRNQEDKWMNLGAQVNLAFKHWYNLESTLSTGIAQAWNGKDSSFEWFISFKLLKD